MKTVFYDFKRSFLRFSVILFIVIFAAIGIAVSYETYATNVSPNPYYFHDLNVIGVSIQKYNETEVIGYVFNNHGNPINNAQIIAGGSSYRTNASGYFELNLPQFYFEPIAVSYNNQKIEFIPLPVFENGSEYLSAEGVVEGFGYGTQNNIQNITLKYAFVVINNNGKGTLILAIDNPNNQGVYVNFANYSSSFAIPNTSFKYVGNVTGYINFYHLQTPSSIEFLSVQVKSLGPYTTEYYPDGSAITSLVSGIIGVIGGFTFIFAAIMLYLAYILFSKPRDTGALKFILARPVTRRELYINRYLGGVLTAIISSFLLTFLSYSTLSILVSSSGILLPVDFPLILFVSTSAALIGFFSLVYMLPSFIKSGGEMLGISIFLFLLFQIGPSVIAAIIAFTTGHINEIIQIIYGSYYFSPLGAESFGIYYLGLEYGTQPAVSSVHLPLVILSSIIWIAIPFIIGLIKFNKINI